MDDTTLTALVELRDRLRSYSGRLIITREELLSTVLLKLDAIIRRHVARAEESERLNRAETHMGEAPAPGGVPAPFDGQSFDARDWAAEPGDALKPPKSPFEVTVTICAETTRDLYWRLRNELIEWSEDRVPVWHIWGGAGTHGEVKVEVRDITPEQYRAELQEWFEASRKARAALAQEKERKP